MKEVFVLQKWEIGKIVMHECGECDHQRCIVRCKDGWDGDICPEHRSKVRLQLQVCHMDLQYPNLLYSAPTIGSAGAAASSAGLSNFEPVSSV